MSSPPAAAPAASALLLHCSPARTVWLRRATRPGSDVVAKVYVSGSQADAERECQMGQWARGPGVVEYLAVETDQDSNRPAVLTRYVPGENLERVVATLGAMPALEAATRLLPVAEALSRLHGLRTRELPRGMCHGDVKPQNLLVAADCVLLLDFEHAAAIGTAAGDGFTGGTTNFAPPEAMRGAAPNAAFDVFGLGATLAFLVRGGGPADVPQHQDVRDLIARCTAADAAARPNAGEVAKQLARLADLLRGDGGEAILHDWANGALALEPAAAMTLADDPRARPWLRRRRLLERLPELLRRPPGLPAEPGGLLQELQLATRALV
jgi:serine/threonine protein kinase